MACLKGKPLVKKKEAKVICDKCGSLVKKKGQVCKPVKLKPIKSKGNGKKTDGNPTKR